MVADMLEKSHESNNVSSNSRNFQLESVKDIVENLLIDEDGFFNEKISKYLLENKSKFTKKLKLTPEKEQILNSTVYEIDFNGCDIFESVNLNDGLMKVVLTNIIKETYGIVDSNFHEVHFWKDENTFCIFNYKNEVKRYNSFSEDTMKSIYEKFSKNINFIDIIEAKINEEFDFENYSEEELKKFYEGGYKSRIIKIIKDEFYNFLPSLVFDNLDDEVMIGMVQYFYRKNFDDINDIWLSKFNSIVDDNISEEINDPKIENRQIVETVIKKFIRFNSNEIIEGCGLNKRVAEYVFENEIKNIIDFIDNHPNFSKDKASHEFENNSQYIKNLILKYNFYEGEKIIKEYSENTLGVDMDNGLVKSILSNNVLAKGVGSLSFEFSKLIFKYLIESFNDYSGVKVRKGFQVFFDNYDGGIDKNGIKKQLFKPIALKEGGIDHGGGFGRNFVWEFENLLSRENLAIHNFNLKKMDDVKHHVNLINESLKGFNLRSVKQENCVSEGKFVIFHLIKEFSNVLITKK